MGEKLPDQVNYWLSEAKHDCFFVLGPESGPTERIGAVKAILMGYSQPMRAMLQDSELAEPGDVRLIDVDPETFRTFLKCVYGAIEVIRKLSFDESAKLLYITEKYLVHGVSSEVSYHLCSLYSPENIFNALSHMVCLNNHELQEQIMKTLKSNLKQIILKKEFLELSVDAMKFILQQEHLYVDEIKIWGAVFRWARKKTNSSNGRVLRSYIFPLMNLIRFLSMDPKDFWRIVVPTGILLKKEIYEICQSYHTRDPPSIKHLCAARDRRYDLYPQSDVMYSSFFGSPRRASIHCILYDVVELNYSEHSEYFHWKEALWSVVLTKETHYLGFYITCFNPNTNLKLNVAVELTLFNQLDKSHLVVGFTHIFDSGHNDKGYDQFFDWHELLDRSMGFVINDSICVMAQIRVNDS